MVGSLVLIPWPETAWSAEDRVAGRTPIPLTDAGRETLSSWAESLASVGLGVVYSSAEKAGEEAARVISDRCGARRKVDAGLAEVDAGLWSGLTHEELKRRDAKLFKRWFDDPTSVCPPEGEGITTAFGRLDASLSRVRHKSGDKHTAVVLGPLAFALLRCEIESVDPAQVRSMMNNEPLRYESVSSDGGETKLGPPARVIASDGACAALESAVGDGQGA
jgi:broad specificity phosphatase PhoE